MSTCQEICQEIYQEAFNDELEKIAEEKGVKPGYFKSIIPGFRAYYSTPLKSTGTVLKGEVVGGGKGLVGGAAGGAAVGTLGTLGALAAKALKKGGKVGKAAAIGAKVGKAAAIGAGVGGYSGLLGGIMVGNRKGYQKAMAPKGIKVKYPYGVGISHEFSPEAAKKYKVKM